MEVDFRASGAGVNAQSIGEQPPDCGEKSMAVLGPLGAWECQPAATSGSGSMLWLILAAAAAYWWFVMRKQKGDAAL